MIAKVLALVPFDSLRHLEESFSSKEWIARNGEQVRLTAPVSVPAPDPLKRLRICDAWPDHGNASTNDQAFILGVEIGRQSFDRHIDSIRRAPVPEYVIGALNLLTETFLMPGKALASHSFWQLIFTDDEGEQVGSVRGQFLGMSRVGSMESMPIRS